MCQQDPLIKNLFESADVNVEPDSTHMETVRQHMSDRILQEQTFNIRRTQMRKRYGKTGIGLTAAAIAAVIVMALTFIDVSPRSSGTAWAIEQTIAALEKISTACTKGILYNRTIEPEAETSFEIWYRAEGDDPDSHHHIKMETRMDDRDPIKGEFRGDPSTGYMVLFIGEGKDKVKVRSTQDLPYKMFQAWLEPDYFRMLREKAVEWQEEVGRDETTDKACIWVTLSYPEDDSDTLLYCWFQFDVATKLPVRVKQWATSDRNEPPIIVVDEIAYNIELPDDVFHDPFAGVETEEIKLKHGSVRFPKGAKPNIAVRPDGTVHVTGGKESPKDK